MTQSLTIGHGVFNNGNSEGLRVVGGLEPPEPVNDTLRLLGETPFVGSLVVGENGRIDHVDQVASELLMRTDARYVAGRSFDSMLAPRLAVSIREQLASGVRLLRVVVDGWQLALTVQQSAGLGFGMLVQRRGGIIPDRVLNFEVRFLPCGSLGSLEPLSNREIEVASLIGMGMSVREIGEHFKRSIKTIENHRVSIGRKLGVSDRLDIAMIAHHAGLRPEDAGLERL